MNRKDLILDTFVRLVGQFGVDKTNLQDVAKELGISPSIIYLEYNNKDALIKACYIEFCQRFIQSCVHIVEQDLPPEQLLYLLIEHVFLQMNQYIDKNRGFYQYVKDEGYLCHYQKNDSLTGVLKQEILALVVRILNKGVQSGAFKAEDLTKKAELILDAFNIFIVQLIIAKRNVEEILIDAKSMYHLLLNGILKPGLL
jgi:AcrR family transcriptional regulator